MRTAAAILVVSIGAAACADDPVRPAPGPQVAATPGLTFTPAAVSVAQGGTVTWNFGSVPHNVTFNAVAGKPADIPGQNINVAVSRTFAQSGTFAYSCTLHAGMSGSVTVSPPPPPPRYPVSP